MDKINNRLGALEEERIRLSNQYAQFTLAREETRLAQIRVENVIAELKAVNEAPEKEAAHERTASL
jgi:hypothetical protein